MFRKGRTKAPAKSTADSVTVHVCGDGVAYVDSAELLRSNKVKELLAQFKIMFRNEEERERQKPAKQQGRG